MHSRCSAVRANVYILRECKSLFQAVALLGLCVRRNEALGAHLPRRLGMLTGHLLDSGYSSMRTRIASRVVVASKLPFISPSAMKNNSHIPCEFCKYLKLGLPHFSNAFIGRIKSYFSKVSPFYKSTVKVTNVRI